MSTCAGCGQELVRRHQQKFCSNRCQRAAERFERTREWLETGGTPNVGGRPGHFVRRYLLEAQCATCAICGVDAEWMGMGLVFVLDHIDGNSANNARENLRLVCPNCDRPLQYVRSHVGGVSARLSEQWDYYTCHGACGTFQYRQRTRRLRRVA